MISESFVHMALDFVRELEVLFPGEPFFKECQYKFDGCSSVEAINAMKTILGDNVKLVHASDETLFDVISVPGIDAKKLWGEMPHEAKAEFWQRLNALVLVATTVSNTPPELMSGLESIAAEFTEKIQNGNMDLSSMMSEVFQRVQTLDLSAIKNVDIGALSGSLGMGQGDLNAMLSDIGGINPDMVKTVTSLMNDGGEPDLLSILESAKPPPRAPRVSDKKKTGKKKRRKN